jgi:hypothetical protein
LVTSAVIVAMPFLGDVHLDADAQGNGLLAWSGLRGSSHVVQAASVRDGRRTSRVRTVWRAPSRGHVVLEDLDVASSGAAAL